MNVHHDDVSSFYGLLNPTLSDAVMLEICPQAPLSRLLPGEQYITSV